jgi:predicted DNA-binding transcriptional regulator AlpA
MGDSLVESPSMDHSAVTDRIAAFGQGLRLPRAAAYCDVSRSKFLDWVERGIMPKPKRMDKCVIWLRDDLDDALRSLDDGDSEDTAISNGDVWSDVAA